jgi:hypothetical protein
LARGVDRYISKVANRIGLFVDVHPLARNCVFRTTVRIRKYHGVRSPLLASIAVGHSRAALFLNSNVFGAVILKSGLFYNLIDLVFVPRSRSHR